MSDSIIEHNDHPILCPEARHVGESDLVQDQMEFIQQLYSHGIIHYKISEIISKIAGKEFNSTTKSNIEQNLDREIDKAFGIF